MSDFVKNLRNLCAEKKSLAQVCRDVDIRQQQFSRYLNGQSRPSAHTLRKICAYFRVDERVLFLSYDEFLHSRSEERENRSGAIFDPMADVYPGELDKLKNYLGSYLYYSDSPSSKDRYTVGATFLTEKNGTVLVRTVEATTPDSATSYPKSRYNGKACYYEGRIFISEFEKKNGGCLSQTILVPPHRQQKQFLKGVLIGLASKPRRMPFACRTIFKRMPEYLTAREIIQQSAFINRNSRDVDPVVKKYLSGEGMAPISA